MKFTISAKRINDGDYVWEFLGFYKDEPFSIQVKEKDKNEGIEMVKRSLVLRRDFNLKNKEKCLEFLSGKFNFDLDKYMKDNHEFKISYVK